MDVVLLKPSFCKTFLCVVHRNLSSLVRFGSENFSAAPLRTNKTKSTIDRKSHFVDLRNVTVIGGKGGDGCISFLRLFCNPLAGPSGGDGGNGGHVIFQTSPSIKGLEKVPSVIRGEDGENGMSKSMHGASGKHNIVNVPIGTIIKKSDVVVADLNTVDSRFIAARGGAGGHGNEFFLSNENRHPEVAEIGANGETHRYTLELSIMAHVGLVGFPNAGKSTFLRAISRARPKVASYPFTTLHPHIGIVHYNDYEQLAFADLPGIIPDAHKNRGLGLEFLKHIKRCVCMCYVIDISNESAVEQFKFLQYELEQFEEGLSKKPFAVLANKCDLPNIEKHLNEFKRINADFPTFPISAKTGFNVKVVLDFMRKMYDTHSKFIFKW